MIDYTEGYKGYAQMTLGEIIKSYRNENDYSMATFAEKSGISKSYIAILESGRGDGETVAPSIETIQKAAIGMNMQFMELFEMLNPDQNIIVNATDKVKNTQTHRTSKKAVASDVDQLFSACINLFLGAPIQTQDRILQYFDIEICKRRLAAAEDFDLI